MNKILLDNIKKDKKLFEYIKANSKWIILLNRDPNNINDLIKEYKKYINDKRIESIDKFIDNVDLISTVINLN